MYYIKTLFRCLRPRGDKPLLKNNKSCVCTLLDVSPLTSGAPIFDFTHRIHLFIQLFCKDFSSIIRTSLLYLK